MKKLLTLLALAFCLNGKAQCITPTINVTPLNPFVCSGGTTGVDLYASGALTYTWTNGATTIPVTCLDANCDTVNANPQTLAPPQVFTYSVTGTAADGCVSNQVVVTVTVIPIPTPYFVAQPDTICAGQHTTLCIDSMPIITTYTWTENPNGHGGLGSYFGGCVQATPIYSNPSNLQLDTTVSYQVLINVPGCPPYNPHTYNVVVSPLPHVSITKDTINDCNHTGDTLKAITVPASGVTLWWVPKGSSTTLTPYSGNTNEVIVNPTTLTMYYVTPTNEFGCAGIKDSILVLINNTANCTESGIALYMVNNTVTIYPNPNNGSFVVEPNSATKQTMQVYDVNGKMVLSQSLTPTLSKGEGVSIDASSLNEGVYNISIISNDGVVNKRIVIVK